MRCPGRPEEEAPEALAVPDATGLPNLLSGLPTFLWSARRPDRLLVCAEGLEPGIALLPSGVPLSELGGCAVVEAALAPCCGSTALFSAAHRGGGLRLRLHTGLDPVDVMPRHLGGDLGALPEAGRLALLGLAGGQVASAQGTPRVVRHLLFGDEDGRPRAWAAVEPGRRQGEWLAAGSEGPLWFDHPAHLGELERRLTTAPGGRGPALVIAARAPEPALVERLEAASRSLLEEVL